MRKFPKPEESVHTIHKDTLRLYETGNVDISNRLFAH